ncbi:MAG: hypothetical protein HKUEN07_15920 [Rhodocyclaceae bacterium]|jgi:hypothetical protein|uniref:Uncharacterized protein n=1 Tax=Candidatus Desulfobacillus denitrificans TaxID=2608985 RepID=A0A809R047_9PROT|nr:hypothetical protein [Rhodocyclaceae bacterium]BBO20148.1 conserved hypothetical protein [Candidatus Desulfobacillus denitrificans]GIK46041.1 MAG: hypothetical protein BroJett012_19440 [Betaproteobacteria bacterium]GJQ55023.1 MAG: hypothetical protein HKUEN07_15920 [Rhodocyclaceae bacterium]
MRILEKILGPKSKYDRSLPYAYEARIAIFEDDSEHKRYLSDTICGLIEHLHRNGIAPEEAQIFELYEGRETRVDTRLFAPDGRQWLFKPELCRAFEAHYPGHIREDDCSFGDRGRGCLGP